MCETQTASRKQDTPFEATQSDVCLFLSDPRTHKQTGQSVSIDVISTHCAHIFLGPDYAYKIKRAVTYSYLDMATLAQRRKLCLRELEINQPSLPDIYLDVVGVTRGEDGGLELGGTGEVIEWVIRMRRFDEARVLDNIAKKGALTKSIAKSLGAAIAEYHQNLPAQAVNDGYARIAEVVRELNHELALLDSIFSSTDLQLYCRVGLDALEKFRIQLDARALSGHVKRCHGDLHLRNILLHQGKPMPFDALEFDERMATTDTLYDLAFLIMDLGHRGMHEHANIVLNEYLLHSDSDDISGLSLLPLYLFLRAGIKAMTSAQAAVHNPAIASSSAEEARRYLQQAIAYLTPAESVLIAIGGLSGTGKSTVAAKLAIRIARSPGALLVRSDSERKAALHIPETERLPNAHYTAEASAENYARILHKVEQALDAHFPVVLDAVFLAPPQRLQAEQIARSRGVSFYGVWLEAPKEILQQRINLRNNQQGGDASDATVEVLEKQLGKSTGNIDWTRVDASGSVEQTLDAVLSSGVKFPEQIT